MRAQSLLVFALLIACNGSESADTTNTDGGSGDLAQAQTVGMPIVAPSETWTWVPFADAVCANGSATGIGVNLSTKSSRVLLYLEGGGACWDALTCYTLMSAANFSTGYGESSFTAEATSSSYLAAPGGFFDRTAAANPFKDYSFVYVPYCTGDLHSGNNVAQYGSMTAMHVGYKNMGAFLSRIVPTFPTADRIYLAGSSAGGYGATYNWSRTQAAFGSVRVDLIADSAPYLPPDVLAEGNGADAVQRVSWNLAATTPSGCTGCAQSFDALYGFYASAFPSQRGALLSYTQDSVIPAFAGITTAQFTTGLDEEASNNFAPHANLRYFFAGASGHVLFFSPTLSTKSVSLQAWLTQMTSDDAAWTNVAP